MNRSTQRRVVAVLVGGALLVSGAGALAGSGAAASGAPAAVDGQFAAMDAQPGPDQDEDQDQDQDDGRGAPAIANAHLRASADTSDCREAMGTNPNKANWRGKLISNVAQHFAGQEFAAGEESIVTEYVDSLCDR